MFEVIELWSGERARSRALVWFGGMWLVFISPGSLSFWDNEHEVEGTGNRSSGMAVGPICVCCGAEESSWARIPYFLTHCMILSESLPLGWACEICGLL